MSRIGRVERTERVTDEDGTRGLDVVVDPDGQPVTAPHFADPGDDSVPLPGDYAALELSAGSGAEQIAGYADVRSTPKAAAGEKRIYARNAAGTTVVEVWLKADSTIVIANASGSYEMAANGDVTINGVVITAAGEITAPGEITAMAASPATSVGLSTHLHGSGTGPTTAPTPGT